MKIPLLGLILVSVAANEDLCRSCKCNTANVLFREPSPNSDYDWFPLSVVPDPRGRYLTVNCSTGKIGSKFPPMTVAGVTINAGSNGLNKFPEFSEMDRKKVLEMSLPGNGIAEVTLRDVDGYQQLRILDVSENRVRHVGEFSFSSLRSLLKLDLSGNEISVVERWWSTDADLAHLNLADNAIAELGAESFRFLRNLIFLDLSGNFLSTLPDNFASSLTNLKFLHMMENKFEVIPRLPRSIVVLNLTSNSLRNLVLPHIDDLMVLDVSNNDVEDLDNVYDQLALRVFRVNHNRLTEFGLWKGTELKILDLGYNQFQTIPPGVNAENLPYLQRLYLNGNPINEITFNVRSKPFANLDVLGLSHLGNITEIDQQAFKGVLPESYINCSEENGIFVDLSYNKLKTIDGDTFGSFSVCSVDLSNNRLSTVPEDLLPWQYLTSVDLQNNPWNCICELQWMLDKYLPHSYVNRPQNLFELRCATPSRFKDRMMVFWYNSTRKTFCLGPTYYQYEYSEGQYFEVWTASMIACAVLGALILIVLMAILILLFCKPKRKITKRKPKKRMSKPLFREIRINPDHKYNEIPQDGSVV